MQHDARNEPRRALYALLAGAEGCGPAARSARLAHDDELADFLCRVQEEIVGELGALWSPDGDVLRLVLRSPETEGPGRLAFRHGRGEGSDQIVQHAGRQVLRVDHSVRRGGFDGSSVELVDGTLSVVPPGTGAQMAVPFTGRTS